MRGKGECVRVCRGVGGCERGECQCESVWGGEGGCRWEGREGQDDDGDLGGPQQHLWAERVGVSGRAGRVGVGVNAAVRLGGEGVRGRGRL